jgi:hypothetical protein
MSTEPLTTGQTSGTAGSERGLLLAMLLMVVLGVAGMLALSA